MQADSEVGITTLKRNRHLHARYISPQKERKQISDDMMPIIIATILEQKTHPGLELKLFLSK